MRPAMFFAASIPEAGSPRQAPATIAPEVPRPASGNALYVFAPPDRK